MRWMEKKNKSQQIINFTSSFHSNVTDVIYYFLTKCLYLIFLFIKNNIPSVLANKKKDALKLKLMDVKICRFLLRNHKSLKYFICVQFKWGNVRDIDANGGVNILLILFEKFYFNERIKFPKKIPTRKVFN